MKRNFLCLFALGLISIISSHPVVDAALVYQSNFESDPEGLLPAGWTSVGTASTYVSSANNHTGQIPSFSYPDFGSSGTKSLALLSSPGVGSTLVGFEFLSGTTNQFRMDWSYFVQAGLSGTLNFRLYGGNVATDRILLADNQVDLATQSRTLSMALPQPINFTAFEVSLQTDAASSGGTIFIDDVAIQDLAISPNPGVQSTPSWLGATNVWSEGMFEFTGNYTMHCESSPKQVTWTRTDCPEPSTVVLTSLGLVAFASKRAVRFGRKRVPKTVVG
jgi:hypothetical protein